MLETKVTVASLSAEKISETPVPVSLITQAMIKQSGALTLKTLLLTYLPGFNDIEDQNEINIASRGIFTSSQQKILILINGHRLNSRSYSMASPDHSISLDKVKQIEVLRGPASSLYGNVSLTATINIILKSAEDVQGNKLSLLVGNHNQQGASLLLSKKDNSYEALIWASTYKTSGEKIQLSAEDIYSSAPVDSSTATIYGIKDKSPYDLGITLKNNYGEFFLNTKRSHYVEPFSGGGLSGEPYDYDKFQKINGYSPGLGYLSTNFDYKNHFRLGSWENENRLYWDQTQIMSSIIINPNVDQPTYGSPQWKDISLGLLSIFNTKYKQGDLLIGVQIEGYKVYGSKFPLGINSYNVNTYQENMLPSGQESSYSGFFQYKRNININWKTNIGLRYDYKNRKTTNNLDQLSPRLGLIYQKNNTSIKFSFSESFVDANYWNRFSNLASFKGAQNLKPEKLRSLQISPTFILPNKNMQITSNFFYDQAIDVIYRDNSATNNNYSNAGKLNSWGFEQEFSYITPKLNIRFNGTFRQAIDSEKIAINNGFINNIPKLTANLIFDKTMSEKLNLHVSFHYIGQQYTPIIIQKDGVKVIDPLPNQGVSFDQPDNYEKATWLVNSNINYKLTKNFSVNLRVENLFDENYKQGGTTLHPYPKKGRWFQLQAKLAF